MILIFDESRLFIVDGKKIYIHQHNKYNFRYRKTSSKNYITHSILDQIKKDNHSLTTIIIKGKYK